ncbi:hypothetical protein RRF57_007907 [Xylaria bambusicola]|uniref:Uncharacterized protein n=1 Tax=Xylaria bambusicola TaxID=326684 RepID=A0AAN7Z6M9_9PEZI
MVLIESESSAGVSAGVAASDKASGPEPQVESLTRSHPIVAWQAGPGFRGREKPSDRHAN